MNRYWIEDAKACLDVADRAKDEINELMAESIRDHTVLPYMKVAIKNYLENCRSPLDYAAHAIFETYCKNKYTTRELKKLRVYFPIRYSEQLFKTCISDNFKGLSQANPAIVKIFNEAQPYLQDDWLKKLTVLINESKHRHLSKHKREIESDVRYFKDSNGNTFFNSTFSTNGIIINGKPLGEIIIDAAPFDSTIDATLMIDYYFEGFKEPVMETLESIHTGVFSVIEKLEKVI